MAQPTWSEDGQIPSFLAATRMATLPPETIRSLVHALGIAPGMCILDVGCGSGEYTFRLGNQTEGVSYVGVDFDQGFVDFANQRVEGAFGYPYEDVNRANSYKFVQADGLDLPFEDNTFDVVVSHTYLTALPDYVGALAEMCRVCKPGGMVSSITVMGESFFGSGSMQLLPAILDPDDAPLINKVQGVIRRSDAAMDLTSGIPPRKVPVTFAWIGLEDVSCLPLGQYFCLSDAALPAHDYTRFVDLLHLVECDIVDQVMRRPEAKSISAQEWADYRQILEKRRDQLLEQRGSNYEWNWYGSCALHVCGRVPSYDLDVIVEQIKAPLVEAARWRKRAKDAGLSLVERITQSGFGRSSKAELVGEDGTVACAYGLEPAQALTVAFARALQAEGELGIHSCKQVPCGEAASLPVFATDLAYIAPLIWETVSEAAFAGWSVTFHEPSCPAAGTAVVACLSDVEGNRVSACLADTDDLGLSLQLALAQVLEGTRRH